MNWYSKHMHFNGHAQHGVVGPVCQENCAKDRIVLLINWWDHTPEPPNCQRMTNKMVKELQFTRFDKPALKAFKASLSEAPPLIVPVESESLRVGASTEVATISLPPVDMLELTIPQKYANSNGQTVHFELSPEKATILGIIDPQKRTQVGHIQYSQIPVLFAFTDRVGSDGNTIDAARVARMASVLRPIQSALWAGGVVRQHCEMYLAFADQCGAMMQKYGVKATGSTPRIVLQHPAPQGQQPRFSVMEEDFSSSALKRFLIQQGVPVPAGLETGGPEPVGAAAGAEGCIEKFDKLAAGFFNAGNPVLRAEILEDAQAEAAKAKGPAARYYMKTMERIQAKGKKYVASETARLDRLLKAGGLASEKKQSMVERRNILGVFAAAAGK